MLVRSIATLTFLVGTIASAADAEADAKADLARLKGLWKGSIKSQATVNGQKIERSKDIYFEFSGDRFVVLKNEKGTVKADFNGDVKLNATTSPKQLDLLRSDSAEPMKLIYAFEGDKLKLGFPARGQRDRPDDFKEESTVWLEREQKR
jgi:uncharacterized protein (TIGR03067 family)